MIKRKTLCWSLSMLLLVPLLPARAQEGTALHALEAGDAQKPGWGFEQPYFFDALLGPSLDGHMYGVFDIYGIRRTLLGPFGAESTCVEWVHPGDDATRDKMSLYPVYVHFVPFVKWRQSVRVRASLWLDIYAGGSLWGFRAPGSWSTPEEERRDLWEWGHKYFRGAVSVGGTPQFLAGLPLAVDVGAVWSESQDDSSDSDDWSYYVAVHLTIGESK